MGRTKDILKTSLVNVLKGRFGIFFEIKTYEIFTIGRRMGARKQSCYP
jgi:hypothetical protein